MKILLMLILFLPLYNASIYAGAADRVLYFNNDDAAQSRASQKPLLETKTFRILMGYHDSPGQAEVHLKETDIIYCFEGEAEFVTGGKPTDAKEIAPNELRGNSIIGGEIKKIKGGDVLVVPKGVPHWFKSVRSPFRYSVVKIPE